MSAPEQQPEGIDISEVLAEMDDVGRTKWELAVARVQNRRLQAQLQEAGRRVAELENGQAPTTGLATYQPVDQGPP